MSLSTIVAKDGAGVTVAGGIQAADKSGAGTGPFAPANVIIDAAGTNLAAVSAAGALKVDGSAVTQPVSAASLPLPTGASTAAKQPALGTAGAAAADVITVQGIASMTALKVDGSAVTQPVSGTITANIGTAGTLALDATLTGGTQKTKLVDTAGTNVGTIKAASTGAAAATDTALVVTVRDANANGQTTMSASAPVAIASDQTIPIKAVTTSAGTTNSRVVSAATTNATNLKASAGNIFSIRVFNVAAYDVFLKLYNKASAPTVGTDTPVWTIPIKAGTGFSEHFHLGFQFGTGISYAITKLQADSDTTAVAASDVTGTIGWI